MKDYQKWLLGSAAWCVVLALVDFQAIWIYQLSRWALCSVAVWSCFYFVGWQRFLLYAVAILFNPLVPMRFDEDEWRVVNWLGVVAYVAASVRNDDFFKMIWGNRKKFFEWGLLATPVLILSALGLVVYMDSSSGGPERRAAADREIEDKKTSGNQRPYAKTNIGKNGEGAHARRDDFTSAPNI